MTGPAAMAPDVCLTVDFEPDCPPYLWTWRGIAEGAPRLLDLFAGEEIPATYFVTGDTADRFPEAVRAVVGAGHELGCHGMTHRDFATLSAQHASWEIAAAAERLRRFAPVTSFRAPYLRLPDAFVPLLEDNGFTLDSSQARYKRNRSSAPASQTDRKPSRAPRLLRVPASVTSSVLRLPAFVRDRWLRSLRSPVVLFVHPWEFVDLRRERLRLDCRFRTGADALSDLRAVIRLFKAQGARFLRMNALVPNLQGGVT